MNYADIKRVDVANGPGVRVSLFVSGCTHRCPGCFNPETWDFAFGAPFGEEQLREILTLLDRPYIRGLSLLGGEPFEPENQGAVLALVRRVRRELPQKDVWCYTGYLYEQKDLKLRFRGSANQRILDVPASLAAREAALWTEASL